MQKVMYKKQMGHNGLIPMTPRFKVFLTTDPGSETYMPNISSWATFFPLYIKIWPTL